MASVQVFDPDMLVFIDETGCDKRKSFRQYGMAMALGA